LPDDHALLNYVKHVVVGLEDDGAFCKEQRVEVVIARHFIYSANKHGSANKRTAKIASAMQNTFIP
jgi:hypothetical protein